MSDIEFSNAPTEHLETDYLIIGAGAMGMAFADEVFRGRPNARITMVDKRPRPGGHWNDAYPFVALHQPAAFYGLNSAKLGTGGADLASGPEVVAYYHRVMQKMLASGRVQFFSKSEFREMPDGKKTLVSLLDKELITEVDVTTKVVNAGYMDVQVPSTHGPRYQVADDVNFIPINALPQVKTPWQRYVVIGAGKTGMDAVLFLLDRGVDPDKIRWIMPNDSWLWDRPTFQPGLATAGFLNQLQAVIDHGTADEIFPALEKQGSIHRIDCAVAPVKWRCATIAPAEVESLRRVKDVVRLGRVQSISGGEIKLEQGSVPTDENCLHVDCTADGLAKRSPRPIFEDGKITMQSLFMCQQVFSAAIIGRLALSKMSNEQLNRSCRVVPHPEFKEDMPVCLVTSIENLLKLNRHIPLWLRRSRVNLMHHDSLWNYLMGVLQAQRKVPEALAVIQKRAAAAAV